MNELYVEFLFQSGERRVEKAKAVDLELMHFPTKVEGYRFFQHEEFKIDGETIRSKRVYAVDGAWHYFGKAYTYDELLKTFPMHTMHHIYMKEKCWLRTVRTPSGKWYEMREQDDVVAEELPRKKENEEPEQ